MTKAFISTAKRPLLASDWSDSKHSVLLSSHLHEPGLPDKSVWCSVQYTYYLTGGTCSIYDGREGGGEARELHIVNPEKYMSLKFDTQKYLVPNFLLRKIQYWFILRPQKIRSVYPPKYHGCIFSTPQNMLDLPFMYTEGTHRYHLCLPIAYWFDSKSKLFLAI